MKYQIKAHIRGITFPEKYDTLDEVNDKAWKLNMAEDCQDDYLVMFENGEMVPQ